MPQGLLLLDHIFKNGRGLEVPRLSPEPTPPQMWFFGGFSHAYASKPGFLRSKSWKKLIATCLHRSKPPSKSEVPGSSSNPRVQMFPYFVIYVNKRQGIFAFFVWIIDLESKKLLVALPAAPKKSAWRLTPNVHHYASKFFR